MLEQKLSLKLAQKLVMTPSLQQAIKLLQMTRLELEGVLNQEMVENPLLEESSFDEEERSAETAEKSEEGDSEFEESFSDVDLDAYFGDDNDSWGNLGASVFEHRDAPPLENTLTREDDLYDNLLWQLHMMDLSPQIRTIAEYIIGNLDPDGFLVASIEEIQAMGVDDLAEGELAGDHLAGDHLAGAHQAADHLAADHLGEVGEEAATVEASSLVGELAETQPWTSPAGGIEVPGRESASVEGSGDLTPETESATSEPGVAAEGAEAEDESFQETVVGGYPRALVEEALKVVRSLDPAGVACRDLRESLLFQLDAQGEPEESLARRLVAEKWDLFTRRKFEVIARDFGIPLKNLRPAVEAISDLNTRPGRQFNTDRTHYVEPDVHVIKVGDRYEIQLNDNGLPRLRVSRAYRQMLKAMRNKGSEAEARQYIKEKMRSAIWLIKSLDQRQRTIYKVANSIVEQQRPFLDHGVDHLRPMVLRDVAEDIEMHESTVSRVVSNKYIHTPRGLLPMKFFFHSGIDREYGGDISSLTVKRKIKQFIQDEDPKKPLSDSELMRILKREGINIARRTVAKYRDELSIPSSTERKRIF